MNARMVTITVNWDNIDSIRAAEKTKLSLENKGYKLVNQFGGMFHSALIYMKCTKDGKK